MVLQQVLAGPVGSLLPAGRPVSGSLLAQTIDARIPGGWMVLQGGFHHHSTTMETTILDPPSFRYIGRSHHQSMYSSSSSPSSPLREDFTLKYVA